MTPTNNPQRPSRGRAHRPKVSQWARLRAARFRRDQDGAVTVDFIVLTAAVVGLGLAAASVIGAGTVKNSEKMEKCLNIQSRLHEKDLAYNKILKRITRRCGKL